MNPETCENLHQTLDDRRFIQYLSNGDLDFKCSPRPDFSFLKIRDTGALPSFGIETLSKISAQPDPTVGQALIANRDCATLVLIWDQANPGYLSETTVRTVDAYHNSLVAEFGRWQERTALKGLRIEAKTEAATVRTGEIAEELIR